MRTALAFVFGAALVSTTWVFAGPTGHANAIVHPAPHGPPVVEGLGYRVPDFGWQGPGGEVARLAELLRGGPVVVAIRDLNCPVSQRYGSTLEALEDAFAGEGVQFLYVDLTPQEVGWNVGMPRDQADLDGTYVRHINDEFFTALSPQTTTEVFLIDERGVLRYRGAIDDQYGIDFARQAPRTRFLEDALRAVLDGEEAATESTFAPGCYLPRHLEARVDEAGQDAEALTYVDHIHPLVEENCVSCHSEGGPGPFALDQYESLVAHGEAIRTVVAQDRMPPWPANSHYGVWANDQRLSATEKIQVLGWIEAGMPKGVPSTGSVVDPLASSVLPVGPSKRTTSETPWRNGTPDVVFSMAEAVSGQEADGSGLYTFYIPTEFSEDRWVSGAEILPSNPQAVVQAAVVLESPDAPEGERSAGLEGFFAGYAPGYSGGAFPSGTAKRLPAGAWLKLRIHYRPHGDPVENQTRIGLTFSKAPPQGELETRSAFATGFEIPSHAAHHAVTAEYVFQEEGRLVSFNPQMHLRGTAIRYVLEDPRGNEQILLDIPRYYFQFRMNYVAEQPIPVEAGSTLRVTGWYDNSEANLANPDPSAIASFGGELHDELLIGYFGFVASTPEPPALAVPDDREL